MYEDIIEHLEDNEIDIVEFNKAVDDTCSILSDLHNKSLSVVNDLNRLVEFKQGRLSFYNTKISSSISDINSSLTNRYQKVYNLPLNHYHFVDLSRTTACVDIHNRQIRLNETYASKRIPLENIVKDSDVSYYITNQSTLDSGFLEYGSQIKNLFIDYYNYFRYIARSRSKESFTFALEIKLPEQYVSHIRLILDNIVTFVDTIKVSYRNNSTQTSFVVTEEGEIRDNKVEAYVGDLATIIRLEITKTSHDAINFENTFAYFDYYFTIRRIEVLSKNFYRQNVLFTKPMAFGNKDYGLMRNSLKFRSEETIQSETDIKYFYTRAIRGILNNVLDTNVSQMVNIKDGDEITIIPHSKTLLTAGASIHKVYDSNYVYLDTPINATEVLNGCIRVFRGTYRYQKIRTGFYRFWIINLSETPIELDFSDYCTKGYLDTELITTQKIYISRGFYKLAVETEDTGDDTSYIDTFMEYLYSIDTSTLFTAKHQLVYGLPSEVLENSYESAFTLLTRPDKIMADILVSLPAKEEISEKYLVVFDKRKSI